MKKPLLFLTLPASALLAQEVPLTIEPAVEVKIESRSGFQYQIEESSDLSNFTPTGVTLEGNGSEVSALFPVDGNKFFRAQEIPSDIRTLIPGLSSFTLAGAQVGSEDNEISIVGARVTSNDYDLDDFLAVDYCFDFAKQTFIPKGFEVIEDLGPTLLYENLFYALDDSVGLPAATFLGASLIPTTSSTLNVPAGGASILFTPQKKQYIAYQFRSQTAFKIEFINDENEVIGETTYSGTNSIFENRFSALAGDSLSFRLTSLSGNAFTTQFSFADGNRFGTSPLTIGSSFATGSMETTVDYKKFQINLEADRRISLNGFFTNGGTFLLLDARGGVVDGFNRLNGGSTSIILGPTPEAGPYFLVFLGSPFQTNAFSGSISYLP